MIEETFVGGTPRGGWGKGDATVVRNSVALPLDGRKTELRHFARWWSGKPLARDNAARDVKIKIEFKVKLIRKLERNLKTDTWY
jgi:hypothetical protein